MKEIKEFKMSLDKTMTPMEAAENSAHLFAANLLLFETIQENVESLIESEKMIDIIENGESHSEEKNLLSVVTNERDQAIEFLTNIAEFNDKLFDINA